MAELWVALCFILGPPLVFFGSIFMLVCLWALAHPPTDKQIDEDLRRDYENGD